MKITTAEVKREPTYEVTINLTKTEAQFLLDGCLSKRVMEQMQEEGWMESGMALRGAIGPLAYPGTWGDEPDDHK